MIESPALATRQRGVGADGTVGTSATGAAVGFSAGVAWTMGRRVADGAAETEGPGDGEMVRLAVGAMVGPGGLAVWQPIKTRLRMIAANDAIRARYIVPLRVTCRRECRVTVLKNRPPGINGPAT